MDWQLKPLSRKSEISGNPFSPGDSVHCFVYKDEQANILRADILDSELEAYTVPENLLARFTRVVKERSQEDKEAQQQTLNTAEDLFLSLFAEENPAEESVALKQILALWLERKRILRRISSSGEVTSYLHNPTKKEYTVNMGDLDPEMLLSIEDQLTQLIL